jgi:hypothetical protein
MPTIIAEQVKRLHEEDSGKVNFLDWRGMNKTEKNNKSKAVDKSESSPTLNLPLTQNLQDKSYIENLKHEYSEVNNDIRNHSTLRFNIFTVYLAAFGGLASVAFGFFEFKYGTPNHLKLWGRLGGLLVTLLFFYYELRIQSLINHNLKVGKEIELLLGYRHIATRPPWGRHRSHNATNIFFLILIAFWLGMAIKMLITIATS